MGELITYVAKIGEKVSKIPIFRRKICFFEKEFLPLSSLFAFFLEKGYCFKVYWIC